MADLAEVAWVLPDVEEVDWVVVAGFVGEGVAQVGVFPGLGDLKVLVLIFSSTLFRIPAQDGMHVSKRIAKTHRPINKRITPMRPNTLDKPRFIIPVIMEDWCQRLFALNLDLAIRPAWDLNNGVDDSGIVLIGIERDIVPERDRVAFVQ